MRMTLLRTLLVLSLSTALVAVIAGCASTKRNVPAQNTSPERTIVWPAPPDEPRVAYERSVLQPSDLGATISGFKRAMNRFTGATKGNEAFLRPFGIALDESDNLCLTDTGANTVSFYDQSRRRWQSWEGAGKIRFAAPVAVAKRGELIYVADSSLAKVIVFGIDGKLRFELQEHIQRPSGLVISGERLYVADAQQHTIVVFDLHGKFVSSFGQRGVGEGEFNFPSHMAADKAGQIYVTDSMNNRIQVFNRDGVFRTQIGSAGNAPGYFGRPKGVAVDPSGHIYVLDAVFDNIQVFDDKGRLLLQLGRSGSEPGEWWLPNAIAIGRDHRIYVTDSYNHRVQILQYVGNQ